MSARTTGWALPVVEGVVVHEDVPHPPEATFDEDEVMQ